MSKEDVKRYTKFFQQTSTITTDTEAKIPDSIIELIGPEIEARRNQKLEPV